MRQVMVALSDCRVRRPDAARSRPHDLGRDGPYGVRSLRSGARRGLPAGTLGRRASGNHAREARGRRRSSRASPVRLPLDDPRPAVFGNDHQLSRSPGTGNPGSDARPRARLERAGLRAHRLLVQLRVRIWPPADRPHLRLGRNPARLLAVGHRLEPGLHGPLRSSAPSRASASPGSRSVSARRAISRAP